MLAWLFSLLRVPNSLNSPQQTGIIPTTSIVNLIFVLSNHSIVRMCLEAETFATDVQCVQPISRLHLEPPFDFLDLFLPINASSSSRARTFLWVVFHYLESPSASNPFSDDYADRHPGKAPKLLTLTPRERLLENVDTDEELEYGRRMAQYRSSFLQKQIDEEKDKFGLLGQKGHGDVSGRSTRQSLRS
jgi:Ino eighty subunit 1